MPPRARPPTTLPHPPLEGQFINIPPASLNILRRRRTPPPGGCAHGAFGILHGGRRCFERKQRQWGPDGARKTWKQLTSLNTEILYSKLLILGKRTVLVNGRVEGRRRRLTDSEQRIVQTIIKTTVDKTIHITTHARLSASVASSTCRNKAAPVAMVNCDCGTDPNIFSASFSPSELPCYHSMHKSSRSPSPAGSTNTSMTSPPAIKSHSTMVSVFRLHACRAPIHL